MRKQGGQPTTDLVLSAHIGGNDSLFASIMALHVPPRAKVADVTFGKGVFWKLVAPGSYEIWASDIGAVPPIAAAGRLDGVDCRALPYIDASFDCVVLDPPYIE